MGAMFWKRGQDLEQRYAPIQDKDDASSSSSSSFALPSPLKYYEQHHHRWLAWRGSLYIAWQVLCVVMFVSGAAMMALSSSRQQQQHPRHHPKLCQGAQDAHHFLHPDHPQHQEQAGPTDRQCAEQLGVWSPLLNLVEYETRNWTDPLSGAETGYVGQPTEDMEQKWRDISNVPAIVLPFDKLPELNRTEPKRGSRFMTVPPGVPHPSSPGGYVGVTEVFHHLHCLNMLRQYIWRDEYAPASEDGHKDPSGRPPLPFMLRHKAREHTSHCVETLRQALMCSADVTPYLVYVGDGEGEEHGHGAGAHVHPRDLQILAKSRSGLEGRDAAPPSQAKEDFQAMHKCRKFEPLLKYVWDNGVIVKPQ